MTRYVLEIEFDTRLHLNDVQRNIWPHAAKSFGVLGIDPEEIRSVRLAEVKLPVERTREPRPVAIGQQGVLGRDYVDI